jgi:hypothetical protein
MYILAYTLTMIGLIGLVMFAPEPKIQVAIFFLLLANAIFLWR